MKKLTLDEIAKIAGVSRATVSRVINDYPYIRPEIRERVQRVVAETGYRPNLIARSLASSRTNMIGLVIPNRVQRIFGDPYFSHLTEGLSLACNKHDLILSLYLFHSVEEDAQRLRRILGARMVDGLLITADRRIQSFVYLLEDEQMPFVFLGRPDNTDHIHYVDTDNVGGAYQAVKHLIEQGRRRIATVATTANTAGDDRYTGYCKALQDHNLPLDTELVAYGDFSLESGYVAMQQLISHQPDAVFIASDTMAVGALRALREAGLQVPGHIAVAGFDDLPSATQTEPPLTTVRQPITETGIAAVDLLLDIINGAADLPTQKILSNQLIVRASTQ